jgi:hypothetical protein
VQVIIQGQGDRSKKVKITGKGIKRLVDELTAKADECLRRGRTPT